MKYRFLTVLFVCSLSIAFSLVCLSLTNLTHCLVPVITCLVILLTLTALFLSARFAFQIIDPNKTVREAKKKAKETGAVSDTSDGDPKEFLMTFIEIEKLLQMKIHELYDEGNEDFVYIVRKNVRNPQEFEKISFRKCVEILSEANLLSEELANQLITASKTRNYIVHGHIDKIEETQNRLIEDLLVATTNSVNCDKWQAYSASDTGVKTE